MYDMYMYGDGIGCSIRYVCVRGVYVEYLPVDR